MKNKYIAFFALSAILSTTGLMYGMELKNPVYKNKEPIVNNNFKSSTKPEIEAYLKAYEYDTNEINWLVEIIVETRNELKKQKKSDLNIAEALKVVDISIDSLNKEKSFNGKIERKDIDNIYYTQSEIAWLLNNIKEQNTKLFSQNMDKDINTFEIMNTMSVENAFLSLETMRRKQGKETIVYTYEAIPSVKQPASVATNYDGLLDIVQQKKSKDGTIVVTRKRVSSKEQYEEDVNSEEIIPKMKLK